MTRTAGYLFGPFRVDADRRLLARNDEPVSITGKAFDLLLYLIEHRDQVVTKDELMNRIWPDTAVDEANLTQSVSMLRKVLGEKAGDNKYIVTVTGRGYQFIAPIEELDVAPSGPSPRSRRGVVVMTVALALCALVLGLAVKKYGTDGGNDPTTIRLTSLPGEETEPVFSPDGKQVAFVWTGETGNNRDIYVSLVGTNSTHQLTTDPANDTSPAWSPDGQYIAFHRDSIRPAYFVIPAIGGVETKVIDVEPGGKSIGRKLTWSRDGKTLVFSARPERTAPRQLMAISRATGEQQAITQRSAPPGDEDPALSPDGSQIAFVRAYVQLFVARSDGSDQRLVATGPGIRGLAWTADGKSVLYATMRSSGSNLWKIPAAGGRPELMRGIGGDVTFPTVSPDGSKLVYSESRVISNIWRLAGTIDAIRNGGEESNKKLIYSTKSQYSPQISPDGQRIVFVSDRTGSREIWICDRDGSKAHQVTSYGGNHIGTPRWSPDGRSIVFDATAGTTRDIQVIPSEGGTPRSLTTHAAGDVTPSYSRDGKWVYFSSNRTGSFEIWRCPSGGGEAVRITRGGGASPIESYDGRFIYYSKFAEDLGLFRVPVNGGQETLVVPGVGAWGWWAITETGAYFVERDRSRTTASLKFAPFSGPVEIIHELRSMPSDSESILDADRTGTTVLLQEIDERFGDLMLVQGFR